VAKSWHIVFLKTRNLTKSRPKKFRFETVYDHKDFYKNVTLHGSSPVPTIMIKALDKSATHSWGIKFFFSAVYLGILAWIFHYQSKEDFI
jgi:hypothetical protein